jgi:hypothetical protein
MIPVEKVRDAAKAIFGKVINITRVELELETRGPSHAAGVVEVVRKAGYEVELR